MDSQDPHNISPHIDNINSISSTTAFNNSTTFGNNSSCTSSFNSDSKASFDSSTTPSGFNNSSAAISPFDSSAGLGSADDDCTGRDSGLNTLSIEELVDICFKEEEANKKTCRGKLEKR